MIVYEVNLTIDQDIKVPFVKWLDAHIIEMLLFKGFQSAKIFKESETNYCVQYYVNSLEYLNDYFDNHAKKMRNDGLLHFAEKFSATRRIMEVHKKY